MSERRKVFRIEQTAPALLPAPQAEQPPSQQLTEVLRELGALRAMLAPNQAGFPAEGEAARHDEIQRLTSELRVVHSAITGRDEDDASFDGAPAPRITNELEAVVTASEQATQKILAAAEDIDQAANTLSAALKNDGEQGLAQDIRDRVIQIFEACNYQDITGQRVSKVMTALVRIERRIASALERQTGVQSAPPLHGPRLADDRGHVSQSDVDAMFAAVRQRSAAAR
jgi:chemotaxis protein CheZ